MNPENILYRLSLSQIPHQQRGRGRKRCCQVLYAGHCKIHLGKITWLFDRGTGRGRGRETSILRRESETLI